MEKNVSEYGIYNTCEKRREGEDNSMEERNRFTNEELAIAKSVDLTAVASNLG